jgi:hypothetical protein
LCVLLMLGALVLAGCSKKEEPKPEAQADKGMVKKETVVVVPDIVKGKWKAVKIAVMDKSTNKETVYPIDIGSTFTIPGSDVSIKVENFLPHFTMEGATLTSQTNDPKNPAAQIRVSEGGKEIYKGWLFTLYPTTHAFQHPKYGFTLADFVPAS